MLPPPDCSPLSGDIDPDAELCAHNRQLEITKTSWWQSIFHPPASLVDQLVQQLKIGSLLFRADAESRDVFLDTDTVDIDGMPLARTDDFRWVGARVDGLKDVLDGSRKAKLALSDPTIHTVACFDRFPNPTVFKQLFPTETPTLGQTVRLLMLLPFETTKQVKDSGGGFTVIVRKLLLVSSQWTLNAYRTDPVRGVSGVITTGSDTMVVPINRLIQTELDGGEFDSDYVRPAVELALTDRTASG